MSLDIIVNDGKKEVPTFITHFVNSDSNTEESKVFKPYRKNKEEIMGTKAVTVDLKGYINEIYQRQFPNDENDYFSEKDETREIEGIKTRLKENPFFKHFNINDGKMIAFWDTTSEIHHRDMMAHIFNELKEELFLYATQLETHINDELDQSMEVDPLLKICEFIEEGIKGMLNRKAVVGSKEVSEEYKLMLKYSQGFQISSVNKDYIDNENLPIHELEFDSAITRDQEKYKCKPSKKENGEHLRFFLKNIIGEIRTQFINVPKSHQFARDTYNIKSINPKSEVETVKLELYVNEVQ